MRRRWRFLLKLGTKMDAAGATIFIHLWDIDMIICMFIYDLIANLLCNYHGIWEKIILNYLLSLCCSALAKFISKPDGGITALHIASLNGYVDCVQLLLDLHANVAAVTIHYGSSMNLIGWGYFIMSSLLFTIRLWFDFNGWQEQEEFLCIMQLVEGILDVSRQIQFHYMSFRLMFAFVVIFVCFDLFIFLLFLLLEVTLV